MSSEDKKQQLPQQRPQEKPPVNREREVPNLNESVNPDAFNGKRWAVSDSTTTSIIQKGNDATALKSTDKKD